MSGSVQTVSKMTELAASFASAFDAISVIPIKLNGSKQPACDWKEYQARHMTDEERERWFGLDTTGIAAVTGAISGGLELIDFDDEATGDEWHRMMEERYPDILARLTLVRTPRPGLHVWYRVQGVKVPGNMKLAWSIVEGRKVALVETRGEGGYALIPGNPPGAHPSGRLYEYVRGNVLEAVQTITAAEREILFGLARLFDRLPPEKVVVAKPQRPQGEDLSPGDDFDRRADYPKLLESGGWKKIGERGDCSLWQRPGKDGPGCSGTLGHCKKDGVALLRVFSSNAHPFEDGKAYGPFNFRALAFHNGDHSAAARQLRQEGYGTKAVQVAGTNSVPAEGRQPAKGTGKSRFNAIPEFRPFPVEALPVGVREYCVEAAGTIGCDVALVAVPALVLAAGCVGGSHAVLLKSGWTEPSVLWGVTVAESGSQKSPALDAVSSGLWEIQLEAIEREKRESDDYARQVLEWKANDKKGPEPVKEVRRAVQFLTSDATVEALAELLQDSAKGVTVAPDELDSWFGIMTRYGNKGDSTRSDWLKLNSARSFVINRKTSDRKRICVRRPCCSITGTIQPSILAEALDSKAFESGLTARLLMTMPPRRRRQWSEEVIPKESRDDFTELLSRLLGLHPKDAAKREPHVVGLSQGSKSVWKSFYNEWADQQFASEGAQAAAMSKLEAYAARIALVHHVVSCVHRSDNPNQAVAQYSVEAGITLVRWFLAESDRIYRVLRETEDVRSTRCLVEWIALHGGRTTVKRLLDSNRSRYPTAEDAHTALDGLVRDGLGAWAQRPAGPAGGRPTKEFVLAKRDTQNPQNPSDVEGDDFDNDNAKPQEQKPEDSETP